MTQVQLTITVLRLFGLILLIQTVLDLFFVIPGSIAQFFMGSLQHAWEIPEGIAFIAYFIIKLAVAMVVILKARTFACFLFPKDETVWESPQITPPFLLWLGIILIALYQLTHFLPSSLWETFRWFRAEVKAQSTQGLIDLYSHDQVYFPIDSFIVVVLCAILLFRGKTLANWLYRNSK
ncbi:MAG: hypothetical protein JJT75_03525 [Opitutales bacterium]|nr:hypothetical protein [Opitutales bacterium]MCH8540114.1 hypothetical protein [Opitutales bacterium]